MSKKRKLGSNHWDAIHEKLNGQKRDATACSISYSLCPSSLGGGCCPTDRSCGLHSCFATVTTTSTGCPAAFTTCGIVEGGGCCPSGSICQRNGCIAPSGGSLTSFCNANSYLCPSSFSYGCCRNGLSCALNSCVETTSTTSVTITLTMTTTNSNSALTTVTTVVETAYNPPTPTPESPSPLPTPIAKLPALTTTSSASETSIISTPSSGINAKELGGIIGACIFLLLAVLIATYFILRRLNLTIKLTNIGPSTNRPGGSNFNSSSNLRSIGIDSLQQIPSSRTGTQSHHPRTNQTTPSELSDNTPLNGPGTRHSNLRGSREPRLVSFSPSWPSKTASRSRNASSSAITGAYRSLPSSDGSRHWRNDSDGSQSQPVSNPTTTAAELESTDPQGYFDIPIPKTASAMGSGHGRQWSDVSELSNGTDHTGESYELDDTSPKYGPPKSGGYGSVYGSGNYNDKRSLREGVKNKVQDWVGMTSLGRKTSRRKDEGMGFGSINGGLGGFKIIPSPTQPSPSSTSKYTASQDQEQLLRGMDTTPLPSFGREKSRLEAIREALRESGTTVESNTNSKPDGSGEVSNSRAQIARMEELKRADSDLTDLALLMGDGGEKDLKDLDI